jgi:hypothetical protein
VWQNDPAAEIVDDGLCRIRRAGEGRQAAESENHEQGIITAAVIGLDAFQIGILPEEKSLCSSTAG